MADSPIERKLYRALYPMTDSLGFSLDCQVYYPPYTVDFLVNDSLIVECDGLDWHERTADQARKDRERDRWFLWHGLPTARFLGAEIVRNAEKCAMEVIRLVKRPSHAILKHTPIITPMTDEEYAEMSALADRYFNPHEPHPLWLDK